MIQGNRIRGDAYGVESMSEAQRDEAREPTGQGDGDSTARGSDLLWPEDTSIIALASDAEPLPEARVPVFALDDVPAIASFVAEHAAHTGRLQRDGASA